MDTRSNDNIVRTHDGGFVLPIMVFALLLLGVMGAASLQTSRDELLSATAVTSSNLAFYAAEAGIHDAVASWDLAAMEKLLRNPGDSLVESWTTLENGCGYQVVYRRVDAGDLPTHKVFSIESTGQSPGLNGGRQRVGIMVKSRKWVNTALGIGGDALFGGNPTVQGPCADVHSNGDVLFSGTGTMDGTVSASGTVSVSGALVDLAGDTVNPTSGAEEQPIPALDPFDFCSEAAYTFLNGVATEVATGETYTNIYIKARYGWKHDGLSKYFTDTSTEPVRPGVYCFDHNVEITHELGAPGAPFSITILTTASMTLSGNPYIVPAHSDSITIMASGDVNINGNPVAGEATFEGLIYAGAQCQISGAPGACQPG